MSNRPPNEVLAAIRDTVERARAHDQNAMAMIAMIRDNAKKGIPRAKASLKLIEIYIKKNPVQTNAFGADLDSLSALWTAPALPPAQAAQVFTQTAPKVTFWQAIMSVVHGPRNDVLIEAVNAGLDESAQKSFKMGYDRPDSPSHNPALPWNLGRIFGIGRRIQRLTDETFPISRFCPACAWELGEEY